jgi:toxin ParE1/3/4
MTFRLSRAARRDLLSITRTIASDNQEAADHFITSVTDYFRMLAKHPRAGRRRDEFGPGLRSFPVGNYLIFYRIGEKAIEIMHVLHGKRDLGSLLP